MIYVTGDLHGCPLETLRALLARVGFSREDFLYILGDVIDRGEQGAELLLWLTQQSNVQLLLGNHEAELLACSFLLESVSEESLEALSVEKLRLVEHWLENGGGPTMAGFRRLLKQDPELVEGILDYLQDCPLYECLRVNGRRFVLVHAGLEHFRPDRPLEDYAPEELLLARPTLDTVYDLGKDTLVVFGHTPTCCFAGAKAGKALHGPGWVCIDTGTAWGHSPMLLRLEDLEECFL